MYLINWLQWPKDSNWQPFNSPLQPPHLLRNVREVTLRKNNTGYGSKRWKTTTVIHFQYEKSPERPESSLRFVPSTPRIPRNPCSKQQKLLWATSRWVWGKICKNLTHSLSGQPSGELQEVSPVRVSCPALWWLPPFPGNWGQSPSTYTAAGPQTPSTHTHTHTHTSLSVWLFFSTQCPHPSNNNLSLAHHCCLLSLSDAPLKGEV